MSIYINDTALIRICFVGAVLGILAIYLASSAFPPEETSIEQITGAMTGSYVKVRGEVVSTYFHKAGHIFFTLEDVKSGSRIRVVFWSETAEKLEKNGINLSSVKTGDTLEAEGEVEKYKEELEIIGKKARV